MSTAQPTVPAVTLVSETGSPSPSPSRGPRCELIVSCARLSSAARACACDTMLCPVHHEHDRKGVYGVGQQSFPPRVRRLGLCDTRLIERPVTLRCIPGRAAPRGVRSEGINGVSSGVCMLSTTSFDLRDYRWVVAERASVSMGCRKWFDG